jgi:hypothetical protein
MNQKHPFTPPIEDDHNCQVRRAFATKDQAKLVADTIYARTGKMRKVERCRHCNNWHLGDAQ